VSDRRVQIAVYAGLGISTVVIAFCKAVEYANYHMQVHPRAKLRLGK
jgi:hypothetical protein